MFRLVSTWRLPASAEGVWDAVEHVEDWPSWWPAISTAIVVRPAGPGGLGQRIYLVVRSPWGYRLRFGVEIVRSDAPRSVHARVVGDLVGDGEWSVVPTADGCTATIRWHVAPTREPLRSLADSAARPLVWAHAHVMRSGERRLLARLDPGRDHRARFGIR